MLCWTGSKSSKRPVPTKVNCAPCALRSDPLIWTKRAFGGEPSGPQPHPGFIGVFAATAFNHRHRPLAGAGTP